MSSSTYRTGAMSSIYASVGLYLYSIDQGVASANLNFSANLKGYSSPLAILMLNTGSLRGISSFQAIVSVQRREGMPVENQVMYNTRFSKGLAAIMRQRHVFMSVDCIG